jgi:hypothetical protein
MALETALLPGMILYCNNKGVISYANCPLMSLPEKQEQADLIQLIKHLASNNRTWSVWEWVEGHAVKQKGWANCTLLEQLNDAAYSLAKDSLLSALNGAPVMEGNFLFEPVRFKLSGQRVSGPPRLALESDWGYCIAKSLFDKKNIIRADNFDLVWWDGMRRVVNGYPKMYRVWLTKHVLEFSGNNVQMYYWSKGKHLPSVN